MSRPVLVVVAALCGVLLAGCMSKYRNQRDWALETFSDQLACPPERVMPEALDMGWSVTGCGKAAFCDVVKGDWKCDRVELPHLRAWQAVLTQTSCPKERVLTTRQAPAQSGETVVQVDACGTLLSCHVPLRGEVTCQPASGVASSVTPPSPPSVVVPPAAPQAAVSGAEECVPKCRSGYSCRKGACVAAAPPPPACQPSCRSGFVCVKGACVSACNPPCGAGERCSDAGECVPR